MANKPGFDGDFTITTVENLSNQWVRGFPNTKSLAFNGVSGQSQCTVPRASNLTFGNGVTDSPFSVAAWIKPTGDLGTDRFYILSKILSVGGNEYAFGSFPFIGLFFILGNNAGGGAGTDYIAQANAVIVEDEWQHVCATYDGSATPGGIKLYVNGALALGTAGIDPGAYTAMSNTAADLVIGRQWSDLTTNVAEGFIDEVAVFNKELSAADVTEIYSSGNAIDYTIFSGVRNVVSWWRMGDKATGASPNFSIPDQAHSNDARMLDFLGDSTSGVVEDAPPGAIMPSAGVLPVSLATKGILFRQRNKPYLVSRGGNPDDILT